MKGWRASLTLRYDRQGSRTRLAERRHTGPLVVQKPLYPEGDEVCQTLIVHPPGGIVGGDELEVDVDIGTGAHVQISSPGAAKWYRSLGPEARLRQTLRVASGAILEWLPLEAIYFDGTVARSSTRVDLEADAVFLGWDVFALGRPAAGEAFGQGQLMLSSEIWHAERLLWTERARISGDDPLLASAAGFGGATAAATLWLAGAPVADGALSACRDVPAAEGRWGVTQLPQVLVARWLGQETASGRAWLEAIWRVLRAAVIGREAVAPRIWRT